jgi:hypothetical protein
MQKNTKKPNPYNSDCIQALLDIQKALFMCDCRLTDSEDILAELQQNEELRETADTIMHSHKYPDNRIRLVQSAIYDECPERFELNETETKIFDLMERLQDQTTGYVSVIKAIFVDVLHLTQSERKGLQKTLNSLEKKNFIFCIRPYKAGSTKPPVYKINRNVTWIGKQDKTIDKKIDIPGFKQKYKRIVQPTVLPDGKTILTGSLELIDEEVSADQDTDLINNTAELYNGSAPQNDSNRNNKKKQVSVANSNMPKNENILTPEENEMFSGTLKERETEYEQHTNF